jgi:hypothetical protein
MRRLLLLFLFCSNAVAVTPTELAANEGDTEAQKLMGELHAPAMEYVRRIEERRKK